jgi:NAD(P)H-hydrate epimerase
MFSESYPYIGEFEVLDIGWPKEADKEIITNYFYTTSVDILKIYKPRTKFISKHDLGSAFIITGSYGKIGASILTTKACLRMGAGLTTVYAPECAYNILQISVPEAMCLSDKNIDYVTKLPKLDKFNAIAIGPGIGLHKKTKKLVEELIYKSQVPLVLDADALNIISENKSILNSLKPNSILTPHVKEFERLTQKCDTDFDRLEIAISFAKKYKIILILKGAHTAVVNSNGNVFFNSTGNAALAKGGSGDTLTGIIVGLLANSYKPIDAAIMGVYLHGVTADICIETHSKESVIASDIIETIGEAYLRL